MSHKRMIVILYEFPKPLGFITALYEDEQLPSKIYFLGIGHHIIRDFQKAIHSESFHHISNKYFRKS